jgi:hypothetical protein
MNHQINPVAEKILELYLQKTDEILPFRLTGLHIYGSLTLGDFHPTKSDIDFVSILKQAPDGCAGRFEAIFYFPYGKHYFKTCSRSILP